MMQRNTEHLFLSLSLDMTTSSIDTFVVTTFQNSQRLNVTEKKNHWVREAEQILIYS